MTDFLSKLDSEQKQAVTSTNHKIVCLAGAGTGKTTTLVRRIAYEVSVLHHDPQSILCLTFTHAAADEFELRYRALLNNQIDNYPEFGTFHSFCYKVICNESVYRLLGYSSIPNIIDEHQEKIYEDKATFLSHVKLSRSKLKLSYYPKPEENFEYRVFFKTLRKLLIQDNKISFDILCNDVCDLFVKNDPAIMSYKYQYTSIYVDEFQDTDYKQWNFVKSFSDYSNIFVVGDINQAIYSFRGSDSSIIESLIKNSEWKTIKLQTNYRSTEQICNYANRIYEHNDIVLKSTRQGSAVYIAPSASSFSIFKSIAKRQSINTARTTAILCRTNGEVNYICTLLDETNFDTNGFTLKISYTRKSENKNIEYTMCALYDEYYQKYILSNLPKDYRYKLIKLDVSGNLEPHWFEKIKCSKRFDETNTVIETIRKSSKFAAFESYIKLLPESEVDNAITEFSESHIQDILNDAGLTDTIQNENSNLYVGTIHSVKGLEFNNVWVYNANSKYFQLNSRESLNLFYVACTRAKDNLLITSPDPSLLTNKYTQKGN